MPGANSRYRRREGQVAAICLLAITLLVAASPCLAAIKVFEREYTYQASEADSKLTSRTVSLAEVKRLLLEELGTYLESVTEVKNFQLTKDQITALTAGIVRVEVLDERWDGKTYWLKARIAADPDDVVKSIDALRRDREKARDLEEIKKRADALLAENKRLKKELKTPKDRTKKKKQKEYVQGIRGLNAVEWLRSGILLSLESENANEAIEAFTKAIELDPRLINAYGGRGNVYSSIGGYEQAIKDYNSAIELSPLDREYAFLYYNRGIAYYNIGNYEQATRDFKIAARLGFRAAQDFLRKRRISW